MQETWVQSLGWEDPLAKGMATHCSTLAWRSPWTVELGGLQSTGSQRVGPDWATWTFTLGFPGSSIGKESTCNAGDPSSIPESGKSPGEGRGYPLQYSWSSLVAQLVKNLPAMWETWVGKIPWRRERLPTPVFWPRVFHGLYSPWGRKVTRLGRGQRRGQQDWARVHCCPRRGRVWRGKKGGMDGPVHWQGSPALAVVQQTLGSREGGL